MTLTQLAEKHNLDPVAFEKRARRFLLSKRGINQLSKAIKDAREMSDALDKARKVSFEDMNTPINI